MAAFSSHDGHIESIVIGAGQVKVSFQTWNCIELVLIFDDVAEVFNTATMTDIGDFSVIKTGIQTEDGLAGGGFSDTFIGSWDNDCILRIVAKSMKIYELGCAQNDSVALFDVGLDYLGGQCLDRQ